MSVKGLVFLVNKKTKQITYAGPVPATYANITGLSDVDYSVLRDLGAHFGEVHADMGFLTEAETREVGVADAVIADAKAGAWEIAWNGLEQERQDLIEDQRWRVNRHNDQVAMSIRPSEDIAPVLLYMQAIRDLPETNPDPFNIVWPAVPELPAKAA